MTEKEQFEEKTVILRDEYPGAYLAALKAFVQSADCREAVAISTNAQDAGDPGARVRLSDDETFVWGRHPQRMPGANGIILVVPGLEHDAEEDLARCGNLDLETGDIADLDVYEDRIFEQMLEQLEDKVPEVKGLRRAGGRRPRLRRRNSLDLGEDGVR